MPAALAAAALLAAGCLRTAPVLDAPVWSRDGAMLYYAAARPDGTLAIRSAEVATGKGGEVAAGRFSSPPVALALSPDGARVACAVHVRGRPPTLRLHLLSPGGGAGRAVWQAPCPKGLVELCWMPDGQAVLIAADRPGGWTLVRVPASGGKAVELAVGLAEVRAPTPAPDGRRVAFVGRAQGEAACGLYVAEVEGGARKLLASALFTRYSVGCAPAWSPNGSMVAYVAERFLCPGMTELWLWDARSGQRRMLARAMAGGCIAPAWSPDGKAVAYACLPYHTGGAMPGSGGRAADIAVIALDAPTPRTLVADGLANLMPSWSPDGRALAFGTCAEPGLEPHAVRLADPGSGAVRLAERTPAARFVLARARHERDTARALPPLAAEAEAIADPAMATAARLFVARRFADAGRWTDAATHASKAALSSHQPTQREALSLLATAQMRSGQPEAALATLERLAGLRTDTATARRAERLRQAIAAAAQLEARRKDQPGPHAAVRLAGVHLRGLGNPRQALALLFRVMREHPDGPHRAGTGELLFACYERLGGRAASVRVLEWAAEAVGADGLTPGRLVLLGEAAAANGEPETARRWLDRLPGGRPDPQLAPRVAAACMQAAEHFAARDAPGLALATWARAAQILPDSPMAARAALETGKFLVHARRHAEAAASLGEALIGPAEPAVARQALRLLTAGRLHRRSPLAYDAARVGQLARFGFLDGAVALGEQTIAALLPADPRRPSVRRHLVAAYEKLTDYHLATGHLGTARATVGRWLSRANRDDDLPRALARLATCHQQAGDRAALVATLTRLAAEFPTRPEGAEARRKLLRIDTTPAPEGTPR